jgi:hypothetical protein|tara:strand:+ start:110 stop:583 length:474 start_codon:yes stop_codon:yes gene_type:complete
MPKKIKVIFFFVFILFISSCGFKSINQEKPMIYLQKVNVEGSNRISQTLKNNILLISNKDSSNKYIVNIKITKNKLKKIKDKTGKTTRYDINIKAQLSLENINTQKVVKKLFTNISSYNVSTSHSKTINNEKIATENGIQRISENISSYIILYSKIK